VLSDSLLPTTAVTAKDELSIRMAEETKAELIEVFHYRVKEGVFNFTETLPSYLKIVPNFLIEDTILPQKVQYFDILNEILDEFNYFDSLGELNSPQIAEEYSF